MDLLFNNRADLAGLLMDRYMTHLNQFITARSTTNTTNTSTTTSSSSSSSSSSIITHSLLRYYAAYRSIVRAKVSGLKSVDMSIPSNQQSVARQVATRHWMLAASL